MERDLLGGSKGESAKMYGSTIGRRNLLQVAWVAPVVSVVTLPIHAATSESTTSESVVESGTLKVVPGDNKEFLVPDGITKIDVVAYGGDGANGMPGNATDGFGGKGGTHAITLSVTPGEMLLVYPGAAGSGHQGGVSGAGYNGGNGHVAGNGENEISGGGGAASVILQAGNVVVVAGGGGGGGGLEQAKSQGGGAGGMGGGAGTDGTGGTSPSVGGVAGASGGTAGEDAPAVTDGPGGGGGGGIAGGSAGTGATKNGAGGGGGTGLGTNGGNPDVDGSVTLSW